MINIEKLLESAGARVLKRENLRFHCMACGLTLPASDPAAHVWENCPSPGPNFCHDCGKIVKHRNGCPRKRK